MNDRLSRLTEMVGIEEALQYYRSHHRTRGCKITHMIGVPMIALSMPLSLCKPKAALKLQFWGWALQFVGHIVFEKNTPVFLETRDPRTLLAALIFVGQEWRKLLTGGVKSLL